MADAECTHLDQISDVQPGAEGCQDCLAIGARWVHLRMCSSCGRIGCCSESPNTHASKHYETTQHPIMQSFEPGEDWFWCFADEVGYFIDGAPSYAHP